MIESPSASQAAENKPQKLRISAQWKALTIVVCGVVLSAITSLFIFHSLISEAEALAQLRLENTVRLVEMDLGKDMQALIRMQERWNDIPSGDTFSWDHDSHNYLRHNDSYSLFILLDRDKNIFRVAPPETDITWWDQWKRHIDFDTIAPGSIYAELMTENSANQSVIIFGFPIQKRGTFDGYMFVLYDIGRGIEKILETNPDNKAFIEVTDKENIIFSNIPGADKNPWKIAQTTTLDTQGFSWTVRQLALGPNTIDNTAVILIFLIGTALSFIMAFAMAQSEKVSRYAKNLKQSLEQEKLYKARLEAIVEDMVDGLITINERGIVQSYNKSCEHIFGYKAEEVIGRNISMLMPEPDASQHDGYLKNYRNGEKPKIIGIGRELEGKRKNGEVFPIDLSVAKLNIEESQLFSGIVRDITERKKAENSLMRSNQELEKFAYVASHDLKEPLRNIDNLAKWAIEDMAAGQQPGEKLTLLRDRVFRLEKLLDDILSYSRAGRIVEKASDVDVSHLLHQIIETRIPPSFSVVLPDELPTLTSPRTPLEQIFSNLLVNAVKHHDKESGTIKVSCEPDGNFYKFSVQDDGPGIPIEYHERIFEMFQTLKSRDEVDGSGLGMSIIKKLVEWQNGKVWVESKDGERGTKIVFLWPKNHQPN
ncbi:MAG: PAS domain S-box protein [Alphaproteobacteria bacterium]|nr:PAS domain S-box protein [Alphaproteobacteria bacterium]MCD8570494.1 PAS domain S-box protein [Alphaproteobacteria bacterium]